MVDPQDILKLTERYNRPWLQGALDYANAYRAEGGHEGFGKWFKDPEGINWYQPFFRSVDGIDHTHFFIDIDIRVVGKKTRDEYRKYPDRLRNLKIEAGVEFFRQWQAQHSHLKFFWKCSGGGLHAIQRIDRKIDRSRLIPVLLSLFPPSARVEIGISPTKNAIHVKPLPGGRMVHPNLNDDGWTIDTKYDPNSKKMQYDPMAWAKLWKYKGIIFKFIIDLHFFYNNTRIVRWTYSPYFKIPGRIYYSSPITKWDIKTVLEESVIEGLNINKYNIPPFQFQRMVKWEETVDDHLWIQRSPSRARSDISTPPPASYNATLISVDADLPPVINERFDKMSNEFSENVRYCPPCMREFYTRAFMKGSSHWARFPIGRYLRAQDYTITDIANWYRFRINDEEDNTPENRDKLLHFLPYVLGPERDPYKVPRCANMQTAGNEYYVCDEAMAQECGRTHPLGRRPRHPKVIAEVKMPPQFVGKRFKRSYWQKIKNQIRETFDQQDNLVIWKATRAGVTTTMIRIALERKKKLLVVVPTNRIGEVTFPEAMKIVEKDLGEPVNGAIFASNRKGCLLLNFVERGLEGMKLQSPDWGDTGIAWTRMRYHAKGDCPSCRHRRATLDVPIKNKEGDPVPLYQSEVIDLNRKIGQCAFITFRQQINNFDVVFVTYSKLYSLMRSVNEDNEELRGDLFDCFDIILLDEVSTFANKSALSLPILRHPALMRRMDEVAQVDAFTRLREEMEQLLEWCTTERGTPETARKMIEWCQLFIVHFEHLKLRDWSKQTQLILVQEQSDPLLEVISHPLDYFGRQELLDYVNKIHGILERYAKIENRLLWYVDHVLQLMSEDSWVISNTPTPVRAIDLRFICAPNTAEVKAFIRQFADPINEKHVFATDACMPEVNLSDFFNIPFKDYVVGDPRQTNKQQLLIADTRNVGVLDFMLGKECKDGCQWMVDGNCALKHTFTGKNPENEYKVEKRSYGAYYKGKCYRYQIEFMRETDQIARMYGPENVMVVLPNIEIFKWLTNRIRYGAIPRGMDATYYRSDKTVGVPCDRRIMLCLGMPYPPQGSHLWLAHYYHKDSLMRQYSLTELEAKLRENSCKQAFWQTIGRAKSPVGKTRSVVMTWGISAKGLSTLFDFNKQKMQDSLPRVYIPVTRGHDAMVFHLVGRFWRKFGVEPPRAMIRLMQILYRPNLMGQWMTTTEIKRFGITQQEIEVLASELTPEMFQYFGVEVVVGTWGHKTRIKVRSVMPSEENLFIYG